MVSNTRNKWSSQTRKLQVTEAGLDGLSNNWQDVDLPLFPKRLGDEGKIVASAALTSRNRSVLLLLSGGQTAHKLLRDLAKISAAILR